MEKTVKDPISTTDNDGVDLVGEKTTINPTNEKNNVNNQSIGLSMSFVACRNNKNDGRNVNIKDHTTVGGGGNQQSTRLTMAVL